jgi:hypothetical protein
VGKGESGSRRRRDGGGGSGMRRGGGGGGLRMKWRLKRRGVGVARMKDGHHTLAACHSSKSGIADGSTV